MRSRSPNPRAVGQLNQVKEPYNPARKNPFFNGLLRLDDQNSSPPTVDFLAIPGRRNISRTMSDIGNTLTRKGQVPFSDDSVLEPFKRAKLGKTASFALANVQPVSSFDLGKLNEPAVEANDHKHGTVNGLASVTNGKSFRVNSRKENLSTISLPQSAASFYNGDSPQFEIVASCPSICKLNLFLKATKDEVKAGVPGKFLHVVMAQDVADVGSVASTISYAFYLKETQKSDQFCTVSVINMKSHRQKQVRASINFLGLKELIKKLEGVDGRMTHHIVGTKVQLYPKAYRSDYFHEGFGWKDYDGESRS